MVLLPKRLCYKFQGLWCLFYILWKKNRFGVQIDSKEGYLTLWCHQPHSGQSLNPQTVVEFEGQKVKSGWFFKEFWVWWFKNTAISWIIRTSFSFRAEHKLHTSPSYSFHKSCFVCLFVFWLFIFRGHSTREPASNRLTYFILRAWRNLLYTKMILLLLLLGSKHQLTN